MGSCNKGKERIYTKEDEGISIVKRGEIHEFIKEQLREGYIRPSKLPQMVSAFFIRKRMVKSIWYRTIGI